MDELTTILVAGAGKIGCTLAQILANCGYSVVLVDSNTEAIPGVVYQYPNIEIAPCDVSQASNLFQLIQKKSIVAIVSCLPYFLNLGIAEVAKANNCHYFDLTEDVKTTENIFTLAKGASTAFVPQCGIAPGFINIIAASLIKQFNTVDSLKLFCGALPQKVLPPLGYALTWSTDGLINEYGNKTRVLEKGKKAIKAGLSGLQKLILGQEAFEAFHTSGGVGTLVDTFESKINTLHYKTIRYPGHCKKMRFLMEDLNLNQDRPALKKILENSIPTTQDDFVVCHILASGTQNDHLMEVTDTRHFYPSTLCDHHCSAIQTVTSTAAAASIHFILKNQHRYSGPIKQEDIPLSEIENDPQFSYLKGQ